METTKQKITKATFKSFIKKNKDNLYVMVKTDFDGMQDCVVKVDDLPHKAESASENYLFENTCGIKGVCLVNGSRNWFTHYEDDMFIGIIYSNCCGSGIIAKMK